MIIWLKKGIVLASLFIFLCPSAFAGFGVRGGMVMSWTGSDNVISEFDNSSMLWCFQGGISYRFLLTKTLSLQPEINFADKGLFYYSYVFRTEKTVHFDYLEFPVLLSFKKGRLGGFLGPFFAVLVHSTPLDDYNDWTFYHVKIRDMDAGIMIGFRYFVQSHWYIEARGDFGLVPVVSDLDELSYALPYKNQTLCLSLGFEFGH